MYNNQRGAWNYYVKRFNVYTKHVAFTVIAYLFSVHIIYMYIIYIIYSSIIHSFSYRYKTGQTQALAPANHRCLPTFKSAIISQSMAVAECCTGRVVSRWCSYRGKDSKFILTIRQTNQALLSTQIFKLSLMVNT